MTDAFDLLARGFFPKELPPPFNTLDFSNRVLGSVEPVPSFFTRSRRSRLCMHNFARIGRMRRVLGIPNPISQYKLAVLIAANWQRLDRLIKRSRLGTSHPVAGRDRALVPGDFPLSESRATIRSNARLLVLADVARFYHSIYTHSIAWAVHGKKTAKQKRGRAGRRLLGNRLDEAVASCQDGQTGGIPVGPDTSLVLSELVASAVDVALLARTPSVKGLRFMDDFEFATRTRREADELLQALHIALGDFALALNPLKTSVSELPLPIDQLWRTPLRTAVIRKTHREQATDLIALFDVAYTLSHQHPDKNVLAYAIGRLRDIGVCRENGRLFQRLSTQCMLAEPGTSEVVLERLAAHYAKGVEVDTKELSEVLNAQIVEHAPLGHSNEVAWALWGTLIFDIQVNKAAAITLSTVEDSVVALLALHSRARGLMHPRLDPRRWQAFMTEDQLYGEHWLLAYEAAVKGWLGPTSGTDHIGGDANFRWLRALGVEFYDADKAAAIAVSAPDEEPEWLLDLEEEIRERRSHYTDLEDDDLSVDF